MSTSLVIEILLGLVAAAIGVTSYMQAMRANREQAQTAKLQAGATSMAVDAAAYTRAREIYEGALATLRMELESTRREIHDLRDSNDRLTQEATNMRISNEGLRAEVVMLRAEISRGNTANDGRGGGVQA